MLIREVSYARAGLCGNPSDIFGGKTIALLFDRFRAEVTMYESPNLQILPSARDVGRFGSLAHLVRHRRQFGYYGGIRIIEALLVRLAQYCAENQISLDERNFTIEYESSIPFAVGLGGSAAILKAVLAAAMRFYRLSDREIPKPLQAYILLKAETDELDISAGPQDRVIVVFGGLVYMDFTPAALHRNGGLYGHYENLDPTLLPPLYVAYSEALSKSSGRVHNVVRYRVDVNHDENVVRAMSAKAELVDEVRALLVGARGSEIGPLLSRDFELRKLVYPISPENQLMIDIARRHGAHANFAGSGGAVIGTYETQEHYQRLVRDYNSDGFQVFPVRTVEVEGGS